MKHENIYKKTCLAYNIYFTTFARSSFLDARGTRCDETNCSIIVKIFRFFCWVGVLKQALDILTKDPGDLFDALKLFTQLFPIVGKTVFPACHMHQCIIAADDTINGLIVVLKVGRH